MVAKLARRYGREQYSAMSLAAPITVTTSNAVVSIPEPQTRGYLLKLGPHTTPDSLAREVDHVAQAGFNLLVFPIYALGCTFFNSESLAACGLEPIHPDFRTWNPLELVTRLARPLNLSVWGFVRPYELRQRRHFWQLRLRRRLNHWRMQRHLLFSEAAVSARDDHWYPCPLQRGRPGLLTYRHLLADLLVEAITAYPLDGLVLDCTGFGLRGGTLADHPLCFCDDCKSNYYETTGASMLDDARQPAKIGQVRAWQRDQAHDHLNYLRQRVLRTRRTLRMVCLASPDWRRSAGYDCLRDGGPLFDWAELLRKGEIEELIVDSDGEFVDEAFGSRMASDFACLGDQILFMPLIRVRHPGEMRRPIATLARYAIPGFIADFSEPLSEAFVIELSSTIFAEPAPLPETEPVRAAMFFLERVRQSHENQPKLHDLMSDMLRLLARQLPVPKEFGTLLVIEQNIHGLEQFIRRGRLKSDRIPETTLRHLGMARRLVRMSLMDVRS